MSTIVYEDIIDVFKVYNAGTFISKEFSKKEIKEDEEECKLYSLPKVELAEKIITAQICFYLLRRTGSKCGSITDVQGKLISQLKTEYKTLTGEDFKYNLEVDY